MMHVSMNNVNGYVNLSQYNIFTDQSCKMSIFLHREQVFQTKEKRINHDKFSAYEFAIESYL